MRVPYDLVRVVWTDASTDLGWEDAEETERSLPPNVTSVGFRLKTADDSLCLASTVTSEGETNNRIIIPKGMVVSVTLLKKAQGGGPKPVVEKSPATPPRAARPEAE